MESLEMGVSKLIIRLIKILWKELFFDLLSWFYKWFRCKYFFWYISIINRLIPDAYTLSIYFLPGRHLACAVSWGVICFTKDHNYIDSLYQVSMFQWHILKPFCEPWERRAVRLLSMHGMWILLNWFNAGWKKFYSPLHWHIVSLRLPKLPQPGKN